MADAVAIREVRKRFGAVQALDGVDFSIARGEFFGLLGPNGAGKSTLMRAIATLQAPTSGSIRFNDIDVVAEPDRKSTRLNSSHNPASRMPSSA
jgi:ABC-type multidrug transport system ATPase subunit